MAKDPRFSFYPDNYIGGTMGFNLLQHGAYLQLLILNFYKGKFTANQALGRLSELTHGNTAEYTELWNFLLPKFATDGTLFWSERMEKEKAKAKAHSEKQSERVKKRWNKEINQSGTQDGITAVIPDGTGNGIGDGEKKEKGIDLGKRLTEAFDEMTVEKIRMDARMAYPGVDIDKQFAQFKLKVGLSPRVYANYDNEGLRNAFSYQLRGAMPEKPTRNGINKNIEHVAGLAEDFAKRHGSEAGQ